MEGDPKRALQLSAILQNLEGVSWRKISPPNKLITSTHFRTQDG